MAHRTATFTLIVGIALGAIAAVLIPRLVGPYLPGVGRSDGEVVQGVVRDKQHEGERLLITVVTRDGTVLATFTRDVANIDILVQRGDSLVLGVPRFEPFVDNPTIDRVVQQTERPALGADSAPPGAPAPSVEAQPPSDTPAARRDTLAVPRRRDSL